MKTADYESGFLELLNDLANAELEYPDVKSLKLNIFEAAGLTRQEIRHSNVLAYLLNPNENHRLKDYFFKKLINHKQIIDSLALLTDAPTALKLALSDFDDLVIRREDMQLDILAWSPNNKIVIVIENKVGANESLNQLKNYREKIIADNRFTEYKKLFIFLTPFGAEGSDSSWLNLSYQAIIQVLEDISQQGILNDDIKFFITHYIELLRRHVVNDDNEIKSVCLSIYEKHREILDLIYKNIDIGGSRNEAILQFISQHDKDLHINNQNSYWLSFNPKNLWELMPDKNLTREWHRQTKPLVFFFSLAENQIKIVIEVGPVMDLDYRNKLVDKLFLKLTNKAKNARSDTYTRVISKSEKFSSNKTIDELSSDEILKIMNSLYSNVQNFIPLIHEVFSEIQSI